MPLSCNQADILATVILNGATTELRAAEDLSACEDERLFGPGVPGVVEVLKSVSPKQKITQIPSAAPQTITCSGNISNMKNAASAAKVWHPSATASAASNGLA